MVWNKKITDDKRDALHNLLPKYKILFNGTLGTRKKGRYSTSTGCQNVPRKTIPSTESTLSCLQEGIQTTTPVRGT